MDDIASLLTSILAGCEVNITITPKGTPCERKLDDSNNPVPKKTIKRRSSKRKYAAELSDSDESYRPTNRRAPKKIIRRELSNNVDTISEINLEEYVDEKMPDITNDEDKQNVSNVSSSSKNIVCYKSSCNESFASKTERNVHVRTQHNYTFACANCSKLFPSNKRRDSHIKRRHNHSAE